jgi:large subunit ribosomal protein L28
MSRVCPVSGKGVLVGNNVSHANNKSKRRFLPNLQNASFFSDVLKQVVRLRITPRAIRTVELKGGIDGYLASKSLAKLSPELKPLKRALSRASERQAESTAV